jgi:hypothetical protein
MERSERRPKASVERHPAVELAQQVPPGGIKSLTTSLPALTLRLLNGRIDSLFSRVSSQAKELAEVRLMETLWDS